MSYLLWDILFTIFEERSACCVHSFPRLHVKTLSNSIHHRQTAFNMSEPLVGAATSYFIFLNGERPAFCSQLTGPAVAFSSIVLMSAPAIIGRIWVR